MTFLFGLRTDRMIAELWNNIFIFVRTEGRRSYLLLNVWSDIEMAEALFFGSAALMSDLNIWLAISGGSL